MRQGSERIERLHREAPLTDVHVHPSLKSYLFRRNLWHHWVSGGVFNPFASRSDFKLLDEGGVGVIWSSLHVPERQLFSDCFWLRAAAFLLLPVYWKLMKGSLFNRLIEMMDAMEREIGRRPDKIELARSAADVGRIRGANKIAVVHTVEGAHVLEGDPDKLDMLAARGVAMLTLTHFYPNGLAAQVDAIPRDMFVRKICDPDFQTGAHPPLTSFGRAVLRKMGELGMIVDVAHCSPRARRAVFEELGSSVPIMASHVGVSELNGDPYNLTDDEIQVIAASGGAIGIIFMTYFLDVTHPRDGLEAIWKTAEHIWATTGSWDHVVLGTDFDGFTDPPDDVHDAAQLGAVTEMLLERGLDEDEVKKVLGGNAQRVLETGWS